MSVLGRWEHYFPIPLEKGATFFETLGYVQISLKGQNP